MATAERFAVLLSVFVCMAPVQLFLLLVQLYILSSLVDWFLVLLPSSLSVALLLVYGALQLCRRDRSELLKVFDVLFFSVSGSTLLAFFLLLARHLNGDGASSTWLVVFVPLNVFALALIGFQVLERLPCKTMSTRAAWAALRHCGSPPGGALDKRPRGCPPGSKFCQTLLVFFWATAFVLTFLIPLAAARMIPWDLVFVLAYIGLFALLLDMAAVHKDKARAPPSSSANVVAKWVVWAALVITAVAFHVHTAVGEVSFPAWYILGGLLIAALVALFAILYIRWQCGLRAQKSQQFKHLSDS